MILTNGRTVCDREVGSPRTGWCLCDRRAVAVLTSRVTGGTLHACARHEAAMIAEGNKLWRRLDTRMMEAA